jgi:aldose 1-epimerase
MAVRGELTIERKPFGTVGGKAVDLFTMSDGKEMTASVMSFGGTLVSVVVPDKKGNPADVVLGFDSLDGYLTKHPFFGVLVGRYANRIGGASFTLDGKRYQLAANEPPNTLHGGVKGFDKAVWSCREVRSPGTVGVELKHTSPAGDEGFPGELEVTVVYRLNASRELAIEYGAVTDAPTVVNLTNHAYWNLEGAGNGDILGHILTLNADRYTPAGPDLIPTGEIAAVKGTVMDFTKPTPMGEKIEADFDQLKNGLGWDHNWVINGSAPGKLVRAALVHEKGSGRAMEVLTTEPGVQFYSGNHLNGSIVGKSGKPYAKRGGFCLETQHFPDSPNKPSFPSTVLRPGQVYRTRTVHGFSVK